MSEQVKDDERQQVLRIVRAHHPDAKVTAFGSRIRGDARPYSDLDIGIELDTPMALKDESILRENFAATDIPYKIDFVDMKKVDEDFKQIILKSGVHWPLNK